MIIWINGPFGAGKTSLASALQEYCDNIQRNSPEQSVPAIVPRAEHSSQAMLFPAVSMLFDPEPIGSFLRNLIHQPTSDDYQDIPLWREMIINTLLMLHRHYPHSYIIIPMTLVNPVYLTEVFEQLHSYALPILHIWLKVSTKVLQTRIKEQIFSGDPLRDVAISEWRLRQISRCLAAEEHLPPDTRYINGELSPIKVLESVIPIITDYRES